MEYLSAGDGKTVAAVVTVCLAIAAWVRWALGREDRRAELRSAKLERWEASLVDREKDYREKIEGHLKTLENELLDLRGDLSNTRDELGETRDELRSTLERLLEVTVELRKHAPDSAALKRAEGKLRIALPHYDKPLAGRLPSDMQKIVDDLDKRGKS